MAAAGALALAGALASYPVWTALGLHELLAILGVAALSVLAVSLASAWSAGILWSLLLLGGEYIGSLYTGSGPLNPGAPLYGGALFLLAELAYWSLDLRGLGPSAPDVQWRRTSRIALLALGGVALGELLLIVSTLAVEESLVLTVVGAAAAIGVLALLASLVWRR